MPDRFPGIWPIPIGAGAAFVIRGNLDFGIQFTHANTVGHAGQAPDARGQVAAIEQDDHGQEHKTPHEDDRIGTVRLSMNVSPNFLGRR